MKQILTYLLIVLALVSCAKANKDELKSKIHANKQTIKKLKKENEELEKELAKINDGNAKFKIPVVTTVLHQQTFHHFIEASGLLEAEDHAIISPEVAGQLTKIYVSEGQAVKKGQLLASLNSSILSNAIKEIESNLELATTVYNRQENLWNQKIGSELEYLQAKSNKESLESALKAQKAQLDLYNIRAPFTGFIDDIMAKEGELSAPGSIILQLVSLNKMKVNADVSEAYLPFIKKGDSIQVSFPTYPDIVFNCPVFRTGNVVHPDNRTFNVQVVFDNINKQFKPNMMAKLTINDYSINNALVVPSAIIKNDITGKFLFVEKDGKAKKIYVETGKSYKDETVISKGLKENDRVITKGFNTVSDGTLVEVR